jgi:plastocyanin
MIARVVVMLGCAACSSPGAATPDAPPPTPDAPPVHVVALEDCPSVVAATIIDSSTAFVPQMTNIRVHETVKISMNAEHTVIPNTLTTTDPALMVGRGQTKCFRFQVAGTYGIACGVHGFAGTIVVQ